MGKPKGSDKKPAKAARLGRTLKPSQLRKTLREAAGKKQAYVAIRVMTRTLKIRSYQSFSHMMAAIHFAKLADQLEDELERTKKFSWSLDIEHAAYVKAAIFSAVAFLEATINELFSDAGHVPSKKVPKTKKDRLQLMANIWGLEHFQRHASTLSKYQVALNLAGKKEFEKGKSPYQDAALVVELRNALTHFKPGWFVADVSSDPVYMTEHELEKKLRGKFSTNPFTGRYNPFFPDKCLSAGCAAWALETSHELVKEFFSRMGSLIKIRPTIIEIQ